MSITPNPSKKPDPDHKPAGPHGHDPNAAVPPSSPANPDDSAVDLDFPAGKAPGQAGSASGISVVDWASITEDPQPPAPAAPPPAEAPNAPQAHAPAAAGPPDSPEDPDDSSSSNIELSSPDVSGLPGHSGSVSGVSA